MRHAPGDPLTDRESGHRAANRLDDADRRVARRERKHAARNARQPAEHGGFGARADDGAPRSDEDFAGHRAEELVGLEVRDLEIEELDPRTAMDRDAVGERARPELDEPVHLAGLRLRAFWNLCVDGLEDWLKHDWITD